MASNGGVRTCIGSTPVPSPKTWRGTRYRAEHDPGSLTSHAPLLVLAGSLVHRAGYSRLIGPTCRQGRGGDLAAKALAASMAGTFAYAPDRP
jgi:hypothetical protein